MAEPSPTEYTIYRIPASSPRFSDLVLKFRDTKLAALEAEPNGFATKHADEVLHPVETWQQRLAAPATVLICVANSDESSSVTMEDVLLSGEWVGMATIRGSLPYSTFHIPDSGQPVPSDPDLETRWHLCNLYTLQAHRGRGLAKKLVNASIEAARDQTGALDGGDKLKARIRLFCNPEKTFLVTMYKRMGFQEAGMITLKEAFVANGDAELIPEDTWSEEKRGTWERRYGLSMEKIVEV